MSEIVEIKGVGPVLAKACAGKGYGSVEKIAAAVVVELAVVPGVSEVRAKQLIDAAKTLLNGGSMEGAVVVAGTTAVPTEQRAKKAKSKKNKDGNKKSKKEIKNKRKPKKGKGKSKKNKKKSKKKK